MASYFSENEAENLQNVILPKFLTLKWNILRTIWHIEVGDGSFFCIFDVLLLERNFFLRPEFPFNASFGYLLGSVRQVICGIPVSNP